MVVTELQTASQAKTMTKIQTSTYQATTTQICEKEIATTSTGELYDKAQAKKKIILLYLYVLCNYAEQDSHSSALISMIFCLVVFTVNWRAFTFGRVRR